MRRAGFTLIEVLFALFILATVGLVIGQSVVVALRAEEGGRQLRESSHMLPSLQAADWLELDEEDALTALPGGWQRAVTNVEQGANPTQVVWRVTAVRNPRGVLLPSIAWRPPEP